MNSQEFIQTIVSDQPPVESVLTDLQGLIGEYPYFQAAHIVLVRSLKSAGNESFFQQLGASALVIPDKAHLLHLLSPAKPTAPVELPFAKIHEELLTPVEKPVEEIHEESLSMEPESADMPVKAAVDEEQPREVLTANDELRQQISDTLDRQQGDIMENGDQSSFMPVLGVITPEEVTTENAAADYLGRDNQQVKSRDIAVSGEDDTSGGEEEILTLEEETAVHVPPEMPYEPAPPDEGEEEEEQEEEEEGDGEEEEESEQDDMGLLQLETEADRTNIPGDPIMDKPWHESHANAAEFISPPPYLEKEQSFSGWLQEINQLGREGINLDNPSGHEAKHAKFELIDRFITKNPRIEVRDPYAQRLDDFSEKSVEEHESFLTDTLARIYIKQGLFSKALFVYEKLLLKYPEKSSYFTAQITELKRKLNN